LHERAQESADIGPHDPFSTAKMGHHIGSNRIRLLPAKGRIAGYTELARISQRVMRISSSDACRFRGTGRYGTSRGIAYIGLMLAATITLPHFLISSEMSLPQSAGEPPSTVPPRLASRALNFGSAMLILTSLFSLSMRSAGVPFGAPMPYHALAS